MRFKQNAKIETSDFWYDLTDGGYIRPKNVLCDESDIVAVDTAIQTLEKFKYEAERQGVLEEI